jgi:hypothetical protein
MNGARIEMIYVDEEAQIHERDYCRRCKVWKLIHYMPGNSVKLAKSCEEWVPSDNLEYLEYVLAHRLAK